MIKIDLHTHTKNVKSGETSRVVSKEDYYKILSKHKVRISAITNHNEFDLEHYLSFAEYANDKYEKGGSKLVILPGIEFDVFHEPNSDRGHLIIVFDPKDSDNIEDIVKRIYPNRV